MIELHASPVSPRSSSEDGSAEKYAAATLRETESGGDCASKEGIETPISQDRSPGQGFGRSSRFASLSRPAFAPLPRRPPCERGGSFRNKPVPEDEPMRNFHIDLCAKTRPLSGTDRQDHRRARGGNGALAATLGQDRRRRRDCAGECRHRPSLSRHQPFRPRHVSARHRADPRWCSYRQAAERGWQVRKGEKSTPVYFYKPIEIEDRTAEDGAKPAASRCCARSRSSTPARSTAFPASSRRSRPRPSPSASRTSRSSSKRAASRCGSAATGRSTALRSTSFRCLRTKPFTVQRYERPRYFMNWRMRLATRAG